MDVAATKQLFSTLIQKPVLTDQLLQRPPFKFLHDIVHETFRSTGFPDIFTPEELDSAKASASRDSKLAFLQRLVDVLNIDGSLDDVKPTKIVAGKEPELTNLLLQKLASDALAHVASNSKKKSSSKKNSKSTEILKKSSKEASSKEKKSSKASSEPKEESSRSKSKSREHKNSKEKISTKEKKASKSSKPKEKKGSASILAEQTAVNGQGDEGIGSPHVVSRSTAVLESSRASLPDRESSGGTSKGEDSGIADETGAESERHDSARILARQNSFSKLSKAQSPPQFFDIPASTSTNQPSEPVTPVPRPTTSAGRPQTSVARPGTAVTRAPPPKLKKTKVAEIDTTTVSAQPASVGNAALILEDDSGDKKGELDEFLVEEDEEAVAFISSDFSEPRIASMDKDAIGHGLLVNKIIENTKELEKEAALTYSSSAENADLHESRRIRLEIESVQKAIQSTTQAVQPLTRTIEHITDDFDAMLKEIEESRKSTARTEQLLQEQRSASVSENTFALTATLRNLDAEIKHIRLQISSAVSNIIKNEKKIDSLLSINLITLCKEAGSLIPAQFMSTANIRLWQHVVDSLQTSNLFLILKYLINEHREKKETAIGLRNKTNNQECLGEGHYMEEARDILFVALDRFNRSVDREQFDRQYAQELKHLPPRIRSLLSPHDYAPKPVVIACRRIWLPLDIL